MDIAILSKYAEALDLAVQLQKGGHKVWMCIEGKADFDIGKGIIDRYPKVQGVGKADLVIMDDVGFGGMAENLRKSGKPIIGGSTITDRLENDREYGIEMMDAYDITIPPYETFSKFDDAISFIKKTKKRYVFKPFGQKPRYLTHVSKTWEEMEVMLKHFKKIWVGSPQFILQEFIEGIEMAVGGWFNGKEFIKPVMPNFEFKKLARGDLGPQTGEMGSCLKYVKENKLFDETLAKCVDLLAESGYCGYLDINCILQEKKAFGLEWTSRFGYPTVLIQDELQSGDWGSSLLKLAQGSSNQFPVQIDKWAVGVAVVTLPWPLLNKSENFKNRPIFLPDNLEHIHFSDVQIDEDDVYKQAGECGYIVVCTGSDSDLATAKEKAYKVVNTVDVPGGYYRDDIADRVINHLSELKKWGWL